MPTKRAWVLLTCALIFYLLANQTQVGWVYIFSNVLFGLVVASFFYARRLLNGIRARRHFAPPPADTSSEPDSPDQAIVTFELDESPAFYEDDPIQITLHLVQHGWRPVFLLHGEETCPFAPLDDQVRPIFIPSLFRGQPLKLTYQTTCDRRGQYTLSGLPIRSEGPFGLFKTGRTLSLPSELLIYPAYYPLKRLRLLERREFAERQAQRAGTGGQVIGTRDYRPGDSLRTIHWRSTARTGNLVVKEFADDQDLSLTVALDLSREGNVGEGKVSSFETAIRIATSFCYFAHHHQRPFHLIGLNPRWQPPAGALSWWAGLNYLAKVQNDGTQPLTAVLKTLNTTPLVIVLVSKPERATLHVLRALQRQGVSLLPLFITPAGDLPPGAEAIIGAVSVSPHNWASVLAGL